MISSKDVEQLFKDTQIAFDKAPIKKYASDKNLKWHYSISSTILKTNSILIIGFNWGASSDQKYDPQNCIPIVNFKDLYEQKDLGSLQRIYQPLKKYFPEDEIENCVQTNFCFFRSSEENQITFDDIELSTPLFNKLIGILKPNTIIGFSSTLRDYFLKNNLCSGVKADNFPSNKRSIYVVKGIYKHLEKEIPIFFLPHPNSKFTAESRQKAWEFCFQPQR